MILIKAVLGLFFLSSVLFGQGQNLYIPNYPTKMTSGTSSSSLGISGASDKIAGCFQAPKTGSIRQIGFTTGTTTTGDTLDIRLETVGTDGNPSGTLFDTTTNVSLVLNASDDNVWKETGNLTADASVTKGDHLCVVVVNGSVGNFNLLFFNDVQNQYPLITREVSSSWGKQLGLAFPFGIEYSDGTYAHIPGSWIYNVGAANNAFNNGSTPDEYGMIFQFSTSVEVTGWWAWMASAAAADYNITLYDTDGTTELLSEVVDGDFRANTNVEAHTGVFSSEVTLTAGSNYRIALRPTTANNVTLVSFRNPDAAKLDQLSGGKEFHLTTQSNVSGSWTETTTDRPLIGLIVNTVAGGGLITPAFIDGGMQ